jgi:hypothetical protein
MAILLNYYLSHNNYYVDIMHYDWKNLIRKKKIKGFLVSPELLNNPKLNSRLNKNHPLAYTSTTSTQRNRRDTCSAGSERCLFFCRSYSSLANNFTDAVREWCYTTQTPAKTQRIVPPIM